MKAKEKPQIQPRLTMIPKQAPNNTESPFGPYLDVPGTTHKKPHFGICEETLSSGVRRPSDLNEDLKLPGIEARGSTIEDIMLPVVNM